MVPEHTTLLTNVNLIFRPPVIFGIKPVDAIYTVFQQESCHKFFNPPNSSALCGDASYFCYRTKINL